MAQTPLSRSTSYLTPAEFLRRKDHRVVGDLCGDDDRRLTYAELLLDANLQAALDDAAGEVESRAAKGKRYVPLDLAALTGVSQKLLYKLVAEIAYWFLQDRRKPGSELTDGCKWAFEKLAQLEAGEAIFGTEESADAGLMEHQTETRAEVEIRNGATVQAERLFGRRANRFGR